MAEPDPFKQPPPPAEFGASNFERLLRRGQEVSDDPFANFSSNPPKPNGPFRSFTRRNKYRAMAGLGTSRDRLSSHGGSNSSLSSLSGSSHNLLDPAKLMSMQEDARSRTISAAVMKHRLYESVVTTPRRRRFSMRVDYSGPTASDAAEIQGFKGYARMVQSMPVTPAHSENVTPAHSPTSQQRKFLFGFYSRGATPHGMTPEEEDIMEVEEDSWKGLASLFKPQPRFISASQQNLANIDCNLEDGLGVFGIPSGAGAGQPMDMAPPMNTEGLYLQEVPRPAKMLRSRSPSPRDVNVVAPTSF